MTLQVRRETTLGELMDTLLALARSRVVEEQETQA